MARVMRGGGRWWTALVGVALLVVLVGYASGDASTVPSARAGDLPCPNITRSSPATASTNLPPGTRSPCPGVVAGTFLGGSNGDVATDVAVDAAGNSYVTGWTLSPDFPWTPGAYDPTFNGAVEDLNTDAFLAKFDSVGALVFSTFLGGSARDHGVAIALDQLGNVYLTGDTTSLDFPTTEGAFDAVIASEGPDPQFDPNGNSVTDAFIAKFDSNGNLVYSTFLGGSEIDGGTSIAVDSSGNAYVAGGAQSSDFPITQGVFFANNVSGDFGSRQDTFVAKLGPDGTKLVYSTVLGGGGGDEASGIALDAFGNAYVAGLTSSPDFPVTPDAFDTTFNLPWPEEWETCCPYDAFLFKLNPDATALGYSTFLGGDSSFLGGDVCIEQVAGIAADPAGIVYVTGFRGCLDQEDLPEPHPFPPPREGPGGFVVRFEPSGMPIGEPFLIEADSGALPGISLDGSGYVYLAGTAGNGFPTTPGAYDRTLNGGGDAFAAKLDAQLSNLLYSTLLGGGDEVFLRPPEPGLTSEDPPSDWGASIAIDSTGNATVVGWTASIDFPVTEGAYDSTYNDFIDAFVIRMELIPEPNRAPVAYFEATVSPEVAGRVYVNASDSEDATDSPDRLQVRWDWEDDGVWDTGWSAVKTASHNYAWAGVYTIRLEVRDTGDLTDSATREVVVAGPTPPPPPPIPLWVLVSAPAAVALGLGAVLLLRRRSRKGPPAA